MQNLPETILQFGGGRFLRGFVDVFVQDANLAGQAIGRVVVVQSTRGERANALNAQAGRYHILTRGLKNGQVIDQTDEIASVSRALTAQTQWPEIRAVAASPTLRCVVSNTTEKGLALDPLDMAYTESADMPPHSFPARLLILLKHRYEQLVERPGRIDLPDNKSARPNTAGLTLLPCELIERNGHRLRDLVLEQARLWHYEGALLEWLQKDCRWLNTLVDRIVSGPPADHPLLATDALLATAEPFALWAIEVPAESPSAHAGVSPATETSSEMAAPFGLFTHPAITYCHDVTPYYLRKVRILNAAHTALVCKALPLGFTVVRQALQNADIHAWLQQLLFEEIVPTLEGRVEAPAVFARQTLERFANPFLEHKLSDIALYHEMKREVRLVPTSDEFRVKFGHEPPLLSALLAEQDLKAGEEG